MARDYWATGIRHIVALRGDAPAGTRYQPHPEGYAYAADLVAGLKAVGDFEISVAAYCEGHPEALSAEQDLDNLKRKIDAGATRAITQYFFDVELYARFLERARKAGITVPIVPGLLPVTNFGQVVKFSAACGTAVPRWLADQFEGLDQDPETRRLVAASVAAEQAAGLRALGCDQFHFYTLNRASWRSRSAAASASSPARRPRRSWRREAHGGLAQRAQRMRRGRGGSHCAQRAFLLCVLCAPSASSALRPFSSDARNTLNLGL